RHHRPVVEAQKAPLHATRPVRASDPADWLHTATAPWTQLVEWHLHCANELSHSHLTTLTTSLPNTCTHCQCRSISFAIHLFSDKPSQFVNNQNQSLHS